MKHFIWAFLLTSLLITVGTAIKLRTGESDSPTTAIEEPLPEPGDVAQLILIHLHERAGWTFKIGDLYKEKVDLLVNVAYGVPTLEGENLSSLLSRNDRKLIAAEAGKVQDYLWGEAARKQKELAQEKINKLKRTTLRGNKP